MSDSRVCVGDEPVVERDQAHAPTLVIFGISLRQLRRDANQFRATLLEGYRRLEQANDADLVITTVTRGIGRQRAEQLGFAPLEPRRQHADDRYAVHR